MTGRPAGRIQGDDLIGEVLRNMEEGLFRIRRKTLVPSIYRIYLNPDDYEPFRNVVPFIAGEIRAALDERLALWNGSKRRLASALLEKIGAGESASPGEFVRGADQWMVDIYPDLDGKLKTGEIEIYSELGAPEKTEYGGGSLTRRIFPSPPQEPGASATRRASSPERISGPEPINESSPRAASATASPAQPSLSEGESAAEEDERTKGRAFAYLRYTDEHGQKTFEMTRNQIVIGRGGRSYWVDLKLDTLPDVSREHCRIRRDSETGRFTIEDVSQFGTAVNGKPVGRNGAAELPQRATISLAGVIDLNWEAA
jgi:pSer/pThr/pTyr-binding forkhead associated (FHA) protein